MFLKVVLICVLLWGVWTLCDDTRENATINNTILGGSVNVSGTSMGGAIIGGGGPTFEPFVEQISDIVQLHQTVETLITAFKNNATYAQKSAQQINKVGDFVDDFLRARETYHEMITQAAKDPGMKLKVEAMRDALISAGLSGLSATSSDSELLLLVLMSKLPQPPNPVKK